MPLTKKVKGMRMGKGVGKLNSWQCLIRGGACLLEFKNLRLGRSVHFFKKLKVKIPTPSQIILRSPLRIKYLGSKTLTPLLRSR